jgi:hypothetical protein
VFQDKLVWLTIMLAIFTLIVRWRMGSFALRLEETLGTNWSKPPWADVKQRRWLVVRCAICFGCSLLPITYTLCRTEHGALLIDGTVAWNDFWLSPFLFWVSVLYVLVVLFLAFDTCYSSVGCIAALDGIEAARFQKSTIRDVRMFGYWCMTMFVIVGIYLFLRGQIHTSRSAIPAHAIIACLLFIVAVWGVILPLQRTGLHHGWPDEDKAPPSAVFHLAGVLTGITTAGAGTANLATWVVQMIRNA